MNRLIVLAFACLGLAACDDSTAPVIESPANLTYDLEPSGDPLVPAGLLLRWEPVSDPDLEVYNVYSRSSDSNAFLLRASTTSTTFHDEGVPDLDYHVTAVNLDGEESEPSESVIIDERLRLVAPAGIVSFSLDGAVQLAWADNSFTNSPEGFEQYRVYSNSYSLDENLCGETWLLEGTTVSPDFLATLLTNGFPRCFAVSAESIEGFESLWSDVIADTPRPDARNVLIFARSVDADRSGFRFFQDIDGDGQVGALELGVVTNGFRTDIDFRIFRNPSAGDSLFIVPERVGTRVVLYSDVPVDDLTSIDLAPVSGYSANMVKAEPGKGYVFETSGPDLFVRYGALRPTHVGDDHMIFDWSYQTDPGNPELSVHGGLPTFNGSGIIVTGARR